MRREHDNSTVARRLLIAAHHGVKWRARFVAARVAGLFYEPASRRLYVKPPDHAVALCVDEKSQNQALDRTAPLLPLRPGVGRASYA